MTKPIEKMTIKELEQTMGSWLDGDLPHDGSSPVDPFDVFDEMARRNRLLVEALKKISDFGWHDEWAIPQHLAKIADDAIKQANGE